MWQRAIAEDLEMDFQIADAQNLPFADGHYDGVVSIFGAMFAPDQPATARELIRVCKGGGKIALASWTPSSFIGRLCKIVGSHMSASPGFKAPANWGREEWIEQHFANSASSIKIQMKHINMRFESPEHFLSFFRNYYGLLRKAFEKVGPQGEAALESDIVDLINEFNVAENGMVKIPSQYAQVIVVKRNRY